MSGVVVAGDQGKGAVEAEEVNTKMEDAAMMTEPPACVLSPLPAATDGALVVSAKVSP